MPPILLAVITIMVRLQLTVSILNCILYTCPHISGCLAGMDYRMSGVQLTCDDLSSVDNCSNTTSESGCFCSNGNVLEDGVCIRPGECPSKIPAIS